MFRIAFLLITCSFVMVAVNSNLKQKSTQPATLPSEYQKVLKELSYQKEVFPSLQNLKLVTNSEKPELVGGCQKKDSTPFKGVYLNVESRFMKNTTDETQIRNALMHLALNCQQSK